MKKLCSLILLVTVICFMFASCDNGAYGQQETSEEAVVDVQDVYGTYARQNIESTLQDYFTITINPDGTYTYYATMLSSYIGMGNYTFEDNVITLIDEKIPTLSGSLTCTFKFEYRDGKLIYLATESDAFMYINPPDGAEFERVNIQDNETK